jgi:hypothetical protein
VSSIFGFLAELSILEALYLFMTLRMTVKISKNQALAKNLIPNISKFVSQADNHLHSIMQWYMTYIEENNSLHALLLK